MTLPDPPDLQSLPWHPILGGPLQETLANPTRFQYNYQGSQPDWGGFKRYNYEVAPVGSPASHEFTDEWGKTKHYGYDPELVEPHYDDHSTARFGPTWRWRGHPEWRQEAYRDTEGNIVTPFEDEVQPDPGLLYRGLSHEEWEDAKRRGNFQSNREYNIGGEEGTMFSTDPGQARSYATGFAPWHRKPGFLTPSYVIAVPRPADAYAHPSMYGETSETVVPSQVPFSSVRQAWQFRPYAMKHGEMDVRTEDYGKTWMGRPNTPISEGTAWRPMPLDHAGTTPEGTFSKTAAALYQRWVFSPSTGQVVLADNTGDPLQVRYHTDLANELNEPGLIHGYAEPIKGGWRLKDWDGKPVEDQFVVAQVMRALQAAQKPSGALWEPEPPQDWSRVHHSLPT